MSDFRAEVWSPGRYDAAPPRAAQEVTVIKNEIYSSYDLGAFKERQRRFFDLDFARRDIDVLEEIKKVVRDPALEKSIYPTSWDSFPRENRLWRARSIDRNAVMSGGLKTSDFWAPPAEYVGEGRLNRKNEPLLYACLGNPYGPLFEARLHDSSDAFALISYKFKREIRFRRIGETNPDLSIPKPFREIEAEVSRFLAQVLSMPVFGKHTYSQTSKILHELYFLEPGWEMGWIYGSVLFGPDVLNVALEPRLAREKLSIVNVVFAENIRDYQDDIFVDVIAYANNERNKDGKLKLWRRAASSPISLNEFVLSLEFPDAFSKRELLDY
ncbi:hypothetical protein [Neomicrococcus lactis]|uniref:hypothetical protein n=1 Tax=Neomicrococcus lactis TaxID=732241 RepID=UPI0023017037|nr:hypothetical protein [Neomicrococcus lactis]